MRVYDFTDPAQPALLSTLDVSGTPVLLAGGTDFGLVAETTEWRQRYGRSRHPAAARTRRGIRARRTSFHIAKNPRALALSPDDHWGIVVSDQGYTLMQINSPSDIGSHSRRARPSSARRLATRPPTYSTIRCSTLPPLETLAAMQADRTLELDGVPSLVALNADASTGVVVLDGNRLVFFDPAKLQKTGELTLDWQADHQRSFPDHRHPSISARHAVNSDDKAVTVLDAANPQKIAALSAMQSLDKPIRALAIFQPYLIVTDGVTIHIFSAESHYI